MSSFRPSEDREAPTFVRVPLYGGIDAGEGFAFEAAPDASVEDERLGEATDANENAVDQGLDPEQVAAREAEAFARGLEAGRAEAASIDSACAALAEAACRLDAIGAAALAANRVALIELATTIARNWVGRELESSPEAFVALLDRAISRLPEDEAKHLRLAPSDAERVEAFRSEHPDPAASRWRVSADPNVPVGGFVIEGEASLVDGRVATVLADLESNLAEALDAPAPDSTASVATEEETS